MPGVEESGAAKRKGAELEVAPADPAATATTAETSAEGKRAKRTDAPVNETCRDASADDNDDGGGGAEAQLYQDEDGNPCWRLRGGGTRRVVVKKYHNRVLVDIREWYTPEAAAAAVRRNRAGRAFR